MVRRYYRPCQRTCTNIIYVREKFLLRVKSVAVSLTVSRQGLRDLLPATLNFNNFFNITANGVKLQDFFNNLAGERARGLLSVVFAELTGASLANTTEKRPLLAGNPWAPVWGQFDVVGYCSLTLMLA